MKKILVFIVVSILTWETVRLLRKSKADLRFLTHREWEILHLITEGCTDSEIAIRLHFKPEHLEKYVCNILKRLSVPNVSSAIKYVMDKGMVSMTYA